MAATITPSALRTKPFFRMGVTDFRAQLFSPDKAVANAFIGAEDGRNEWRILAGAIPAMSFATGVAPVGGQAMAQNKDMNEFATTGLKPSDWPERAGFDDNWLHSDIRNMAYVYTRHLFDYLANTGEVK